MIYFILFLQGKINKIPKNLEMISNERRETRDRQLRQKVYCKKKHTSVASWKLRFKVARGLLREHNSINSYSFRFRSGQFK